MRPRLIIFALLTACLLMVGRTAANPHRLVPNAMPAYFLPLVLYDSPAQPLPSATPVASDSLRITGTALIKPRWAIRQLVPSAPVAYQIILDTSGSMSWNFAGQGSQAGTIQFEADTQGVSTAVQCETTAQDSNVVSCIGGPADPWWKLDERRLYVVKQALAGAGGLIDALQPNDLMQVIAYSSLGVQAGPGWSGDKALLKTTVLNSGSYQSDRYRSDGGTNSADAIERARQMLAASPPPAPDGQPYRQVTLFLTDGIANIFLSSHNGGHALTNYARDVCPEFAGDQRAFNTPRCQYDAPGYPASPYGERPISAMLTQANLLKQAHPDLPLYVLGIGNVTPFGLDQVASSTGMFYLAPNAAGLAQALAAIQNQIAGSAQTTCIPAGGNQWIDHIDAAHVADSPPFSLPSGIFGNVYIDRDGSATPSITAPITQDSQSGKLIFAASGLTPGIYHIQTYLAYKGDDQVSRQYNWIIDPSAQQGASSSTFQIAAGSSDEPIPLAQLLLDLGPEVSVCP